MDIREQRRLEEQRTRNMRKVEKHIDDLDHLYSQAIRDNDILVQKLHHFYSGESQDFSRILGKIEENTLDFEKIIRRKLHYFEEEKRKISKDFERRMR
jgi:uncharacterized protein YpuA (DUF1002 family)